MKIESRDIESMVEHYADLPYTFAIEKWDDGNGPYYVVRVLELPGCMIHGATAVEAMGEMIDVMRDWIRTNLELGRKIPEPSRRQHYSGKVILRMPPSLHESLIRRAAIEGVSLNQYMVSALSRTSGYDEGIEKSPRNTRTRTRVK